MTTLLPACLCGVEASDETTIHNIPILVCRRCGIERQHVPMTPEQLADWYREQYFNRPEPHVGVYADVAYAHDCAVAEVRLRAYALAAGCTLLDVGTGNGAFVHMARQQGIDAWGQDLAKQSEDEHVYVGPLATIGFPTESYDVITLHDVLEHIPAPLALLQEVRRILRPGGTLIIDFPRFHHESGRHHWRLTEHLWYLREDQLKALIEQAGFTVGTLEHPLPSKVVVKATRGADTRPQIMVPGGIGDAYWVLTKLPGFLRVHGLGLPDVWAESTRLNRSQPFLQTVPWLHAAGYAPGPGGAIYQEAYMQDGRCEFPKPTGGMDWFIAYNGVLRHERQLEHVHPEYGTDWRPQFHFSKDALAAEREQRALGPYIAVFFTTNGMYSGWWREFPMERIEATLVGLPYRIVLLGAKWDLDRARDFRARSRPEWTDLIGQTSVAQLMGVLRGATAVFGLPAGNTLIAPALGTPTVLLWNRYFKEGFWHNCVAPDTPYRALDTAGLSPETVQHALAEVIADAHPRT